MKKQPNILFFFPDQHRFDWLGSNTDIPVRTPRIDQLGGKGIRFTNAITPSPLCAPARACLAAGKEYARCGVTNNNEDYPIDQTTFYYLLREAGYHVAGCGKFDLNKGGFAWGIDGKNLIKEWGFSDGVNNEGKIDGVLTMLRDEKKPKGPYFKYLAERRLAEIHVQDMSNRYLDEAIRKGNWAATYPTPLPDDAYCDNWLAGIGLQLMKNVPEGKPWFLQVNFTGPHQPLDITETMKEWYEGVDFPQPNDEERRHAPYPPDGWDYYGEIKKSWHEPNHPGKPHTRGQNNEVRRNYSAMVENIDRWLGVYIETLKERGELENTLIIYASDHGDMLGDHGCWEKHRPYQSSVGVPFVVAGPDVEQGIVCDEPVTILDLTATFLEYGNVPVPEEMDSQSMRSLFEGRTSKHREYVFSALEQWCMIFDGRYKLIKDYGSTPLLFDLEKDPFENNNIFMTASKEASRLLERLERESD